MILQPANLDAMEVDALQTDRYLDALLAAVERRAVDVPADATVDPTLRRAARRLRDELVRTHPSFRFEERLARRLADAAVRMRLATAAGGEAEAALIPFPTPLLADPMLAAELANPELAALLGVRDAVAPAGGEVPAGATAPDPGTFARTLTPGYDCRARPLDGRRLQDAARPARRAAATRGPAAVARRRRADIGRALARRRRVRGMAADAWCAGRPDGPRRPCRARGT